MCIWVSSISLGMHIATRKSTPHCWISSKHVIRAPNTAFSVGAYGVGADACVCIIFRTTAWQAPTLLVVADRH
eukprot:287394-Rhodomonas_salina.1